MNFYGHVSIHYGVSAPVEKTAGSKKKKDKKSKRNQNPQESRRYQRRGAYLNKRREQEEEAEKVRKARLDQCRQESLRRAENRRGNFRLQAEMRRIESRHRTCTREHHESEARSIEARGRRRERDVVTGPAAQKMAGMRRHRSRSHSQKNEKNVEN